MTDRCLCRELTAAHIVAHGFVISGLRCPACVDAIIEEKNSLVRENAALRLQITGHCARIAEQSELLSNRAEKS